MNRIILSCILGAAALSASAAQSTQTYTYVDGDYVSWGKGKSEIYDVAIHVSNPLLVGKKVTAIRAVINADEGIEAPSLWLSKELKLEKVDGVKVNVPDTYSSDVTVEKITLPGMEGTYGQLYVALDTPYELTADGIYAGYTLTVPTVPQGEELTEKQKEPLLLSESNNPASLYLRPSKDFVNWTAYNSKLDCAAVIYLSIEGDFEEYSVTLNSLSKTNAPLDEEFTVKGGISNFGVATVSKIGYSYSIGGKEYENSVELATPLEPNLVSESSAYVEFPIAAISDLGDYTLDLKITSVNGGENSSVSAAASTQITVLPFVPVHRPILEEKTGTWCGWCTRGYIALEKLNELYGDNIVLAAYHNGDYMSVTAYPVDFGGAPSATLNRDGIQDPYYGSGSSTGFGMKTEMLASMETWVPAAIDVEATWEDKNQTWISVKAVSKFLEDKTDAGYKIGYLLINNGLTGQGSGWIQSNNYSDYGSSLNGTELEILTTWPAKVPNLVFNDVVVDITGMMGIDGSIPANVEYNTPYETTFEFDISKNRLIQDKEQLYVAAFIINPDGTILNANKVKVGGESAVASLEEGVYEVASDYYNLSGIRVASPQEGIFVKVSKMSDGTVRTSKIAR